jgi:hypothetical protein
VDERAICRTCAYYEQAACRIYRQEAIQDDTRTTCNEHRHPAGNDWRLGQDLPPPGMGVYDLVELGNDVVPRLRRPRQLRRESDGLYAGRLGGVLRSHSRMGGHEVVAHALANQGPAGFKELRRTLITGAADREGRLAAFEALKGLDDPRLAEALRALSADEDETIRAQAGLSLARFLDPGAPDPQTLLFTGSLASSRTTAEQAQAYNDSDWARIKAVCGEEEGPLRALRHRHRAQGVLLGARLALHPKDAEGAVSMRAALIGACRAVVHGGPSPAGIAEHVFRRGAQGEPASDRAAAVLVLPFVAGLRLPDAMAMVRAAAELAQAPSLQVAAALAAVQLVRRAMAAERGLDPAKALAKTSAVLHEVHPGFFRVFQSGTRRIQRPDLARGEKKRPTRRPPPPLNTVAQALARGLQADVSLLREKTIAPALRACAGGVLGAVQGPGVFPREWLDGLEVEELEVLRRAASSAV